MVAVVLGIILWTLASKRRMVAMVNLKLCFPKMPDAERRSLVLKHFIRCAQAVLDLSVMWFASEKRIRRIVRMHNEENLYSTDGRPTLVLSAHFVGLEAIGIRGSMIGPWIGMVTGLKNHVFNYMLERGRSRFTSPLLVPRQEGILRVVKAMRRGIPFYYLPDQDTSSREAVFIPFFGFPAATISSVSRLVNLTNARVITLVFKMVDDGYEAHFTNEWENFPGKSVEEDMIRINHFIESWALDAPDQYFWMHKRFKTRPKGEPNVY
jgi:KDO2-lipid IV(A) lauroyltransferase